MRLSLGLVRDFCAGGAVDSRRAHGRAPGGWLTRRAPSRAARPSVSSFLCGRTELTRALVLGHPGNPGKGSVIHTRSPRDRRVARADGHASRVIYVGVPRRALGGAGGLHKCRRPPLRGRTSSTGDQRRSVREPAAWRVPAQLRLRPLTNSEKPVVRPHAITSGPVGVSPPVASSSFGHVT
jgi:hypothetical protein